MGRMCVENLGFFFALEQLNSGVTSLFDFCGCKKGNAVMEPKAELRQSNLTYAVYSHSNVKILGEACL